MHCAHSDSWLTGTVKSYCRLTIGSTAREDYSVPQGCCSSASRTCSSLSPGSVPALLVLAYLGTAATNCPSPLHVARELRANSRTPGFVLASAHARFYAVPVVAPIRRETARHGWLGLGRQCDYALDVQLEDLRSVHFRQAGTGTGTYRHDQRCAQPTCADHCAAFEHCRRNPSKRFSWSSTLATARASSARPLQPCTHGRNASARHGPAGTAMHTRTYLHGAQRQ